MEPNGRKSHAAAPSEKEERIREEILSAACSLIQRYGFRKITLEDIAKAVGKRKSFLYYYYAGKEELLEAVARHEYENLVALTRRIVETQTTARARLRAFILARLHEVRERMNLYRLAQQDMRSERLGGMDVFRRIRSTFDTGDALFLEGLLHEGVASGEFAPLSDEEIHSLSYYALSAQRGVEIDLAIDEDGWGAQLSTAIDVLLRALERR